MAADKKKTKEKEEICKVCQQVLGSKKHLLFGAKCIRFGIREKLKAILHPQDFKALYRERTFGEPRICNLCFIKIKQISKGISTLQELLGDPINVKLYKPHRSDWDFSSDDIQQQHTHLTRSPVAQDAKQHDEQKIVCPTYEKRNKAQLIHQPNDFLSCDIDEECGESEKDVTKKSAAKENKRSKKVNEAKHDIGLGKYKLRNDKAECSVSNVLMGKRKTLPSPMLTTQEDAPHQSKKYSSTGRKRRLKDIAIKELNFKAKKVKKNIAPNKNNAGNGSARDKKHNKTVDTQRKYMCQYDGCNNTFVRKDKYELHLCTHSQESVLYCEKCGKKFGCQRYLDVHYKVHEKNERNAINPPEKCVPCDVSGCDRKFASRVYMKRHVIAYHMGKRPHPIPGIYYSCTFEGCSKKFSLKSTLCRHKMLVHKGKAYRLGRAIVRYSCMHEACGKYFNRKKLLEKHLVLEHNKIPTQMESLSTKDLQSKEHICIDCGMVLPLCQIPHHNKVNHNLETTVKSHAKPYYCKFIGCEMEFSSELERRSHVESHLEIPPLKCTVDGCEETFFLGKSLDNHLWNHCKKISTCDVNGCLQTFDDQLQLAKHSKIHFDGKMKCPWRNCSSIFKVMGTLKQHILAHCRCLKANFGANFVCNVCDLVFASSNGLKNHSKIHGAENSENLEFLKRKGYRCEEQGCEAEFIKHKDFFDHFLNHYVLTDTSCEVVGCKEKFSNLLQKSKHGKKHFGGQYHCPWDSCDKTFASSFFHVKKHVYRHVMSIGSVAADRPLKCSQCDMVFRLECNLTNHQSQHSEKSDYVCPVCGKTFHQNHLKRHMLIHRQEKPHGCTHCGLRYGTINGLKFHILHRHGIGKWPYQCSFCEKGFISSTELRRHLPSHTKEKPFSCTDCGVKFATQTGYKGHMRKHSGQKFTCDVEGCAKEYTTPLSLKGHKAQHAGFSKLCSYCGKTYKNPYGHKCKAKRDAKFVVAEQGEKFVFSNQGSGNEFTTHSSLKEHTTEHTGMSLLCPHSEKTLTDQTGDQCKSIKDNINTGPVTEPISEPVVNSVLQSLSTSLTSDNTSLLQMAILSPATHSVKEHQIHTGYMLTSSIPVSHILPPTVTQSLTLHNSLVNDNSETSSEFTRESDIIRTANLIQPGVFTGNINNYSVYMDPVLSIELL